jgi:hypothetical protein
MQKRFVMGLVQASDLLSNPTSTGLKKVRAHDKLNG